MRREIPMNFGWHYRMVLDVFFVCWFGFEAARAIGTWNIGGFIVWSLLTFYLSYCLVKDFEGGTSEKG